MDQVSASMLLLKCRGDEIWDLDTCINAGVPADWIDELLDRFESGFDRDSNTLYRNGQVTNQFEGVSDLHLAYKLAEFLGIDWQLATAHAVSRSAQVIALQAELDEI